MEQLKIKKSKYNFRTNRILGEIDNMNKVTEKLEHKLKQGNIKESEMQEEKTNFFEGMNKVSEEITRLHFDLYTMHYFFCTPLINLFTGIEVDDNYIRAYYEEEWHKTLPSTLERLWHNCSGFVTKSNILEEYAVKLYYEGMKVFNNIVILENGVYNSRTIQEEIKAWKKLKKVLQNSIICDIAKICNILHDYIGIFDKRLPSINVSEIWQVIEGIRVEISDRVAEFKIFDKGIKCSNYKEGEDLYLKRNYIKYGFILPQMIQEGFEPSEDKVKKLKNYENKYSTRIKNLFEKGEIKNGKE